MTGETGSTGSTGSGGAGNGGRLTEWRLKHLETGQEGLKTSLDGLRTDVTAIATKVDGIATSVERLADREPGEDTLNRRIEEVAIRAVAASVGPSSPPAAAQGRPVVGNGPAVAGGALGLYGLIEGLQWLARVIGGGP